MYGCGDELIRMPVSFPYAVDVPVPKAPAGGRETALITPVSGQARGAPPTERQIFTLLRADASHVSGRNAAPGRRVASGLRSGGVEGERRGRRAHSPSTCSTILRSFSSSAM